MATIRNGVVIDLSGASNLIKASKSRAITLKVVKAAAKPVARAAKSKAPKRKGGGALRKSIGVKAKKGTRGKTGAFAVVGARMSVSKMVKPPRGNKLVKAVPGFYSHLVEKGTKLHAIKKGAKLGRNGKESTGQEGGANHPGTKAQPFLGPAWDETHAESFEIGRQVAAAEVAKELAKQAAKAMKG